jgi:hypothetical protein
MGERQNEQGLDILVALTFIIRRGNLSLVIDGGGLVYVNNVNNSSITGMHICMLDPSFFRSA